MSPSAHSARRRALAPLAALEAGEGGGVVVLSHLSRLRGCEPATPLITGLSTLIFTRISCNKIFPFLSDLYNRRNEGRLHTIIWLCSQWTNFTRIYLNGILVPAPEKAARRRHRLRCQRAPWLNVANSGPVIIKSIGHVLICKERFSSILCTNEYNYGPFIHASYNCWLWSSLMFKSLYSKNYLTKVLMPLWQSLS